MRASSSSEPIPITTNWAIPNIAKLVEEIGPTLESPDRGLAEHSPLNDAEISALPMYVFAAAAMELLGATREWVVKGNRGYETRFLLDLGRSAIRATAC